MNNTVMSIRQVLVVNLTAALLLGTSGCLSDPCIQGEGASIRREAPVEEFHGIQVEGSVDVRFTQGPPRAEMEGQANVIDEVVIEVKDGICHVHTDQCYSSNVPLLIHLSAPSLDKALVNGSGSITADGPLTTAELVAQVQGSGDVSLNCAANTVRATVNGSGDVLLTGSCTHLDATVNGSGDVNGLDLGAEEVVARVTGSGDVQVHAMRTLDAGVTGSGDIRYRGEPVVTRTITGSGDIKAEP